MVNPNRDEMIWAKTVRHDYDAQIAEGVESPRLREADIDSAYGLGGIRYEFLKSLGITIMWRTDREAYMFPDTSKEVGING